MLCAMCYHWCLWTDIFILIFIFYSDFLVISLYWYSLVGQSMFWVEVRLKHLKPIKFPPSADWCVQPGNIFKFPVSQLCFEIHLPSALQVSSMHLCSFPLSQECLKSWSHFQDLSIKFLADLTLTPQKLQPQVNKVDDFSCSQSSSSLLADKATGFSSTLPPKSNDSLWQQNHPFSLQPHIAAAPGVGVSGWGWERWKAVWFSKNNNNNIGCSVKFEIQINNE